MPETHLHRRPAVFFDRDGTLMEEVDYCGDPTKVRAFAAASAALVRLREYGFIRVMVTNQSGIGRGYFSEADFQKVQEECLRQLLPGALDACYHCPEVPEGASNRRKPGDGMVREAAHDNGLDLSLSYMVGDSASDIECGLRAGVAATILVLTGKGSRQQEHCQPDFIAADLTAAADWILTQHLVHHG